MDNPTPHEVNAIVDAAGQAGEHLDALGKTDLAEMDEGEWMDFVERVCTGYVQSMRTRAGMIMLPMTLGDGVTAQ